MERGHLGELLRGVMRRHNLERRVRQRAAMDLWPQVVGPDIARNSWALTVRDGVLHVGVANHAWAQTLHLMRVAITQALNAAAGEEVLRDIRVSVTERARHPHPRARPAGDTPRTSEPPSLTRDQQRQVRDLTARIEDPALRAKVRRAVAGLLRLRRLREAQGARPCARCGRLHSGRGRICPGCAPRR
jgi:predicted nucleic acid-binding Zn ribbon protein